MKQPLEKSDLIFVLGNHDLKTILQGINLFKQKWAPVMAIAGGLGVGTKGVWAESEAETFTRIAKEHGIPEDKIITENKSSNTGENYAFIRQALLEKGIKFDKTIIATKPYMERRAYATAKIHWPERSILVSSFPMTLEEYLETAENPEMEINLIVGDLQRIKLYPEKGFQIYQEIPAKVSKAFDFLVKKGYTKHLMQE